jgi:hypothetical protein
MADTISAAQSIVLTLQKVKAVGKDSKNQQQGFNYRGIDAVVNAVNPVLAEVGGFIVGEAISTDYEAFTTAAGKAATSVRLTAKYSWYGTDGGAPVVGIVSSEANDLADKATAKAWSVALRTFLLQTLMLPTDDPDPDSMYHERGKPSVAAPDPVVAAEWLETIEAAESIAQLQAAWEGAGKAGVTKDPKLIAAKDKRKRELSA